MINYDRGYSIFQYLLGIYIYTYIYICFDIIQTSGDITHSMGSQCFLITFSTRRQFFAVACVRGTRHPCLMISVGGFQYTGDPITIHALGTMKTNFRQRDEG